MKVSELPYKRVTIEEIKAVMDGVLARTRNAKSVDEILAAREDYLKLLCDYRTAESLSYMRYSINTVDEFYVAEKDYYDEIGPEAENYMVQYASTLLDSPFRAELEERLSPVLFKHLEVSRKSMSPEIIDDLVEENKLVSEYSKLMASLEFEFRGESLPRAMLMKYAKSDDRETRREAYEVLGKVLKEHSAELDDIYDRMVHVRDRMAKKMGYKNYVELGYHRMGRIDYDQDKVKTFRENVLNDIVPVVSRLRTENAKRLGIDDYKLYDNDVIIPGGDPVPAGGKAEIFAAAREMYHAMGEETGKFIDMMIDNDAFDVDSRKNKWGGGYCTEFPKYKQPFILANFNGTAGDVDVMTHEAGHALNAYLIADNRFALEIGCGGMETAETHSMSMEFFAWPYMDKFFGEDAAKYRFAHALDALHERAQILQLTEGISGREQHLAAPQPALDIRHLLNVGGRDRPHQAAFSRKQPCPGEGIELDDVLHQKIHTRSVLFCGASPFFLIITESLWKNQKIRCTKDTNVKFSFCLKQTMKPKIGPAILTVIHAALRVFSMKRSLQP